METRVDVFAKVRGHERAEQLAAAREADLLPYFRLIESPALPVMEVEGRQRIMLGSNNYLGLTGDERVRQGRLDKLERQLEKAAGDGGGVLVVVDGVFSMEGDVAPLVEIVELCRSHGARLMVDEAHGAGVLGERGAGTAELLGVEDAVDLRMGTFSKSLASCGGFIAGSAEVIDFLRITSRAFLFTAAAVPAAVGAALAALRVIRSGEGPPLFARVLQNAAYFNRGLHELGFQVVEPQAGRDGSTVTTPIVPVVVGDDWKAVLLWRALYDAGVFVNVALHPAVPPAGALLRTSVMATHDRATLDLALERFASVVAAFEAEHRPP